MKKIVASVGLVAIGASGIQTASAQALGAPDASKPWSVSATLRGFYDDNVGTVPNNQSLPPGVSRDALGFEVSPSAALAWSVDQTTVTLGALYTFRHYDTSHPTPPAITTTLSLLMPGSPTPSTNRFPLA